MITLYVIVTVIVLVVLAWVGKRIHRGIVERTVKEHKDEIDRLNRIIKEKETMIRLLEQRYYKIIGKMK